MRRALPYLGAVALVVVVVIGLTQAGHKGGTSSAAERHFDLRAAERKLAAAPAPLSGLYAQPNTLIGGGQSALDQRLAELKGTPVVINKWASWCVPCQSEFPVFESVSAKEGKSVGFLGIDGHDINAAAHRFLAQRPLPFPSYTDPNDKIARHFEIAAGFPMTVFIGRDGKVAFTHTGPYTSDAELQTDIKRYLQ